MDRKFILGVDLDGVCADYFGTIESIAKEWLGVRELPKLDNYSFSAWGVDQAPKGYKAMHKFGVVQRNMFTTMKPMPNAPQVLRRLSEKNVLIRIITNRLCIKNYHVEAVTQTVKWLEHNGIPYWDLCFIKDKTTVDADLYLEDAPHNVKRMWEAGREVLCFRNVTNEGIKDNVVHDWLEIEREVLRRI
ncbi:hypothetical protein LCGC14_2059230 [marine sediment metagenome]|uniref:5'-nucleotidase n=1 Tax=marine sediment metagenome TaxID=412755 RepID=A0A0F9HIN9_9ZZZZ